LRIKVNGRFATAIRRHRRFIVQEIETCHAVGLRRQVRDDHVPPSGPHHFHQRANACSEFHIAPGASDSKLEQSGGETGWRPPEVGTRPRRLLAVPRSVARIRFRHRGSTLTSRRPAQTD
jgi:hypothetical protein